MKKDTFKLAFYALNTFFLVIVLTITFINFSKDQKNTYNSSIAHVSSLALNIKDEFIPLDAVSTKLFEVKQNKKVAIEQKIRADKIAKITDLFNDYNSPMRGYEELIFNRANECGGDYKVLIGIAGNESGLGRIPYKTYNPYGYLDGKQYSGWEESLSFLSCVISERFLKPCNNDLACIINKYAGPLDDKSLWIRNVTYFINQLQ